MNLKSNHIAPLTAVLFALVLPFSGFAQEDKTNFEAEMPGQESAKQDQETPSGTENPEVRINKAPANAAMHEGSVVRDTELKSTKPLAKTVEKIQKEDEKAQKEENDPLSFNFLYYIIEKFKLSDIVE